MKHKSNRNKGFEVDPQSNLGTAIILKSLIDLENIKNICKEHGVLVIELHKCNTITDFITTFNRFITNKRTLLIFMITLCDHKDVIEYVCKEKISCADIGIYYMNGHLCGNHFEKTVITDMINNGGKLSECSICMTEKTRVEMVICTTCKYAQCKRCHNKQRHKCPICDR